MLALMCVDSFWVSLFFLLLAWIFSTLAHANRKMSLSLLGNQNKSVTGKFKAFAITNLLTLLIKRKNQIWASLRLTFV